MILSGEAYYVKSPPETLDRGEAAQELRSGAMERIFEDVRKRLEVAGRKSVERYNLRCRHVEYLRNDLVYRKNYVLSDAAEGFAQKLAPPFVGPFRVHKRVSPWTYELRDEFGAPKGHVKDLKSSGVKEV